MIDITCMDYEFMKVLADDISDCVGQALMFHYHSVSKQVARLIIIALQRVAFNSLF